MVLISITYHCVGRYNADVMEQRPPAFDAQLVAELVIRIISTETAAAQQQDSKGSSTSSSTSSSTGTGTGSNTSTAPANSTASAAAEVKAAAGKPRDRLSKLRAGAAAATGATSSANTGSTRNDTPLQQNTTATTPAAVTGTGEAVLVFLSGIQAIQKVKSALSRPGVLARYNAKVGHHTSIFPYSSDKQPVLYSSIDAVSMVAVCSWRIFQVYELHGSQSAEQQRRVFRKTVPGEWKIVLATNIGKRGDCSVSACLAVCGCTPPILYIPTSVGALLSHPLSILYTLICYIHYTL